jgi:hypothetical protein
MSSEFDIVYFEDLEILAVNIVFRYSVAEEELDVVSKGLKTFKGCTYWICGKASGFFVLWKSSSGFPIDCYYGLWPNKS